MAERVGEQLGRWPANLVLDEAAAALLGEPARFFYTAKASRRERNAGLPAGVENRHPTVKPLALMRYLIRLVTPPGGTLLDPFAGSGTTIVAAIHEGVTHAIGLERDQDSARTALYRCRAAARGVPVGTPEGRDGDGDADPVGA